MCTCAKVNHVHNSKAFGYFESCPRDKNSKLKGYVPILGIFTAAVRFKYAVHVNKDHVPSKEHRRYVSHSKTKTCEIVKETNLGIVRGILEALCLGIILLVIDIFITLKEAKAATGSYFPKSGFISRTPCGLIEG